MKLRPCFAAGKTDFAVFFRRQIDNDETVNSSHLRVFKKVIDAISVKRVVITHQDDRRLLILLPKVANEIEHLTDFDAGFEGAQIGGFAIVGPSAIGSGKRGTAKLG